MIADSIEGLEQLASELQEREEEQDKQLGELLLAQVVGILLERKEREEKYARARSRVAKSLGLNNSSVPVSEAAASGGPAAAVSGRQARQRRAVRYDYDEYDRSMKSAIRAHERGAVEDFYPVIREPYSAPAYDCEVRRGRSGGPAEAAISLEDIEALRKKRVEDHHGAELMAAVACAGGPGAPGALAGGPGAPAAAMAEPQQQLAATSDAPATGY
eukprot:gene12721-12851_t